MSNHYTQQYLKQYQQNLIYHHSVFQVINVNDYDKVVDDVGVLTLTMQVVQRGVNDDFALRIADYVVTEHDYSIEIQNGDSVEIAVGNTLQLNTSIFDSGVLVDPSPTISYVSATPTIATVSASGGLITALSVGVGNVITASYGSVSDSISISVVSATPLISNNYSVLISGSSSIRKNTNSTYDVITYNNGIVEVFDCVWSITGTGATIASQDVDSCILLGSSVVGSSAILKVSKANDANVFYELDVGIVGLW